ncbi:MAG TPA: hypothetical protein VEF53_20145 [Patescibacteria group bacterium]|nr:hypothetical protein [Patescibacteria group bacterium]
MNTAGEIKKTEIQKSAIIKKIIAIIFIVMIFLCGILTGIFGAREIGAGMLIGYKASLPANPSIMDHINGIIDTCEVKMNSAFIAESPLINLYGTMQKVIGRRIINDMVDRYTVYKLRNGQLTWLYPEYDMTENINNFAELNDSLMKLGTPIIYVQAPFKINKYDNQLPYGLEDTTNRMTDKFLEGIQTAGVKTLDLRETINKEGMDYGSLFFNTDHHWKPEAGLWATSVIAETLEEDYGFTLDDSLFDFYNYEITTYKRWFLGSQGKRVGTGYAGVDDIELIIPKFETNFAFSIPSKEVTRAGNFSETMLFMENIEKMDYFNLDPDKVYTGANYPLNIIYNKNSDNKKKILLVRDSFSRVVAPFLAMACEELHIIDPRHFSEMKLERYVEQVEPDIVIYLYNPSILIKNGAGEDS